jgi:hypothetical protein
MLRVKFEIVGNAIITEVLEQPEDFEEFVASNGFVLDICTFVQLKGTELYLIGHHCESTKHVYTFHDRMRYAAGELIKRAQEAIDEYNLRFGILPIED